MSEFTQAETLSRRRGERAEASFGTRRPQEHPALYPQEKHFPCERPLRTHPFRFVIGADSQLGIGNFSVDWSDELRALDDVIELINGLRPQPVFVSICGDLVDMHPALYSMGTEEERLAIQSKQFDDFQECVAKINSSIPVICLCGNHDVGNRPTAADIHRFRTRFGDDYLSFWVNGCFFICLNTNLFMDPTGAPDQFAEQADWFERQLIIGRREGADRIFVLGHHPWFLYDEFEDETKMAGVNRFTRSGADFEIGDSYFAIPKVRRERVMELCKLYKVDACFAGHFHQNLMGVSSWGMPMITTSSICNWRLSSTGKDASVAGNFTPSVPGIRVVDVNSDEGFSHEFVTVS
jgi:hypothetical protein